MVLEIKVPAVGESISEATLAKWLKADGDIVQQDEVICELESEKATFELPSEKAGRLKIVAAEKSVLKVGDVVCTVDTSAEAPAEVKPEAGVKEEKKEVVKEKTAEPENKK